MILFFIRLRESWSWINEIWTKLNGYARQSNSTNRAVAVGEKPRP